MLKTLSKLTLSLTALASLAACIGGGGDSGGRQEAVAPPPPGGQDTPVTPPVATPSLHPAVASASYAPGVDFSAAALPPVGPRPAVPWENVFQPATAEARANRWDYAPAYPSRESCAPTEGATFEVGPGRAYLELRDVPWLTLRACDQVNVFWRETPYRDIVYIASRGAEGKWITVRGVPNPAGQLPVVDGSGATMPAGTGANSYTDTAGMFIVNVPDFSVANRQPNYKPGYIHFTGLQVRNASRPNRVTNLAGDNIEWPEFATGFYINGAENIAITYCDINANGLGIFVNSVNGELMQARNILIARNHVHNNSTATSFSTHNAYIEAIGTTYELNYFGDIATGSYGDNIKDRSSGTVFRYNYIEGGTHMISLRDPSDSNRPLTLSAVDQYGEELYKSAYIYGNILVAPRYADSVIGHGDGPYSASQARFGQIYFYNNRVISRVDNVGRWEGEFYPEDPLPIFSLINTYTRDDGNGSTLQTPTEVVAYNNLFFATNASGGVSQAQAAKFALFYQQGKVDFRNNWINQHVNVRPGLAGYTSNSVGVAFDGEGAASAGQLTVSAEDPGFTNLTAGVYTVESQSPYKAFPSTYPQAAVRRGLVPLAEPVTAPPAVAQN